MVEDGVFRNVFRLSYKARENQTDDFIDLTLVCGENREVAKELVDFRGQEVSCNIKKIDAAGNLIPVLEEVFKVKEVKPKTLKNGNKEVLVLTRQYDKAIDRKLVEGRFEEVEFKMALVQPPLDFDGDDEDIYEEE